MIRTSIVVAALATCASAWAAEPALEGKATVSFQGTPLRLVVKELQKQTETNIVLGPGVNANESVNLVVSEGKLAELLDTLQKTYKLQRTAFAGAWILHGKDAKLPAEVEPEGKGARALRLPVTVDYDGATLSDVIRRVESRTKLSVSLPARVRIRLRRSGAAIHLRLYSIPTHQLLDLAALQTGLTWKLEDGRVVFVSQVAGEGQEAGGELTMSDKGKVDIDRLVARFASDNAVHREAAVRELILVGKPCLEAVAKSLTAEGEQRPSDSACAAALRVMADVGDPSQYKAVLSVFQDEKRANPIRVLAGDTLGMIGATEAVKVLIEALDDRTSLLRAEAARRALVMIGEPALPTLLERYRAEIQRKKPMWGVIYRGLFVMGEIPTDASKDELSKALQTAGTSTRSKSIRHHAAIGLGMTRDAKTIPILLKALENERDFLIAKYITRSLTWLTEETFAPDPVAWRAWWEDSGKRKFASQESAEDLLKRLAGGTIKVDKGTKHMKESTEERIKRLVGELSTDDATKARAAENDLFAIGKPALPALRKASAGEGIAAKRAAALVVRIESSFEE